MEDLFFIICSHNLNPINVSLQHSFSFIYYGEIQICSQCKLSQVHVHNTRLVFLALPIYLSLNTGFYNQHMVWIMFHFFLWSIVMPKWTFVILYRIPADWCVIICNSVVTQTTSLTINWLQSLRLSPHESISDEKLSRKDSAVLKQKIYPLFGGEIDSKNSLRE